MADKVTNLYNAFVSSGYAMESEAQFRENLKDPKKRKAAYDALVSDGYEMEPYAQFEANIGYAAVPQSKPAQQPATQTPTSAAAQQPQPEQQAQPQQPAPKPATTAQSQAETATQEAALAQPAPKPTRYFNLRSGGKDFNVSMDEVNAAGGIGAWNSQKRNGEELRVYMQKQDGTTVHVPLSEAHKRSRQGYKYLTSVGAQPQKRITDPGWEAQQKWQRDYDRETTRALDAAFDEAQRNIDREYAQSVQQVDYDPYGGVSEGNRQTKHVLEIKHKDPSRIAWRMYEAMPSKYKWDLVGQYEQYFKSHPDECDGKSAHDAAVAALHGDLTQMAYNRIAGETAPKSKTEFFIRKVMDNNLLSKTFWQGVADANSGAAGRRYAAANQQGMDEYGSKHKVLSIAGTIAGMVADPTTAISAGAGSIAAKAALTQLGKRGLELGGKKLLAGLGKEAAKGVAERYAQRTLTGRILSGVAGGAGNFMVYEAAEEEKRQARMGGDMQYKNDGSGYDYDNVDGYSAGAVLKQGLHGLVIGGVTGGLTPYVGNVADKWVNAANSTASKTGIRAGEYAFCGIAEGTIFAAPEIIADPGNAMDIWTDNLAMVLGFKAQHAIKSAPRVIRELAGDGKRHGLSFEERWRRLMDNGQRKADFSKEELDEIRLAGYGRLADIFAADPKTTGSVLVKGPDGSWHASGEAEVSRRERRAVTRQGEADPNYRSEFDGYTAMEELMNDTRVSQAARAKAYYILTGHGLPMGTVVGYTEETSDNGIVTIKSTTADGEVVTSRSFKDRQAAQQEIDNVARQIELNTVDVGERYTDYTAPERAFQAAIDEVWPGTEPERVRQMMKAVAEGTATEAEAQFIGRINDAMERNGASLTSEGIRSTIKAETGVDVDKTLRKKPSTRSKEEQAAVQRYIESLYPEEARRKAESGGERASASEYDFDAPTPEQFDAQQAYTGGRKLLEAYHNPTDPEAQERARAEADAIVLRMQEARDEVERVFDENPEAVLSDLDSGHGWEILADPALTEDQRESVLYYINSKAALDGVMDAANEAADSKRAEVEQSVGKRIHKDNGMVIPATMKVDDRQVYVVKGDVVMFHDGTAVDVRNSSESIVIFDPATGECSFVSPEAILRVDEPLDPQEELQTALDAIEAERSSIIGEGKDAGNDIDEAPEAATGEREQVADVAAYDEAYENALTTFKDMPDAEINDTIEKLREGYKAGTLTDAGRGTLEALEGIQQERAANANAPAVAETAANGLNSAENEPATALSQIPVGEDGEPQFDAVDKETAWDGIMEVTEGDEKAAVEIAAKQIENFAADLEALKKKGAPTKKKPNLKGGVMAMRAAQREATNKYNADVEAYNAQVAEAESRLAAWNDIMGVYKSREAARLAEQQAKRAAANAAAHDAAVAQFEQEQRVRAEKAAEQERIGTHAVNPKIKEKWDAAPKIEGHTDAITLPDGSTIRGRYILTKAGAATASHDVGNAYAPTEGFPIDENGQSVNDRDYQRDKDAQRIVEDMASAYDNRALQSPVIVSADGIVMSGNNRTMSGDLAARQGTDKAYTDYLREFAHKYGFTSDQVAEMEHPRVAFVPDEVLAYDAATFARFNAQEMKSQSKPEAAVKLGKIVPDNVFNEIANSISRYDRLSDYYADQKAVAYALGALMQAGVINDKQMPEMRTGTALSAAGKELIENTLIGKVFQASPDAVRQIISTPTLRQSIVMGLSEIANNRTLSARGYDLSEELAKAVDLVTRAKTAMPDVYTDGMPVSPFGRMQGLFDDEFGDSRVTDATALLLADILNSGKPSDLRKVLASYNDQAEIAAAGQMDIFTGEIESKEGILQRVNEYFRNAIPKEQQALVEAAIARRTERAEAERDTSGEQAADADERSGAGEPTGQRGSTASAQWQTDLQPSEEIISIKPIGFSDFGPVYDQFKGKYQEAVRQLIKMQDGEALGALYHKDIGDIDLVWGVEGTGKSDGYGLAKLVKYHPEVVEHLQEILDDMHVVKRSENRVNLESDTHKAGVRLTWNNERKNWLLTAFEKKETPESIGKTTDTDDNPLDSRGDTALSRNSDVSDDKVNTLSSEEQAEGEKRSLGQRIAAASKEVNTEPTEAQKEAGNYKKGHVQIGSFDVTIEQPVGSVRRGRDANGKEWESIMHHTYGYIRGTEGVDGDHIDVFISADVDGWNGRKAFVVDQYNTDGTFDEHKVMLGFNDKDEAFEAYLSNYGQGWEKSRRLDCTEVNIEDFEKWIDSSHRKTKAFAEYKSVKSVQTAPVMPNIGCTITPTTYTNKRNKTSNVFLVKFDRELSAEEHAAAKALCKEPQSEKKKTGKGWYDNKQGGYMMRTEEAANELAEMIGNEEAVADRQPLTPGELREATVSAETPAKPKNKAVPMNRVDLGSLAESLREDGEVKLSEHATPVEQEKPAERAKEYEVSDEELGDIFKEMRDILGTDEGEVDPNFKFRDPGEMTKDEKRKLTALGIRAAMALIERGKTSFPDYANAMIGGLGDDVRPWLKSFYEAARLTPGFEAYDLTGRDDVMGFDVANFDKQRGVFATANTIATERKAEAAVSDGEKSIKETRNKKRKDDERKAKADTETIASQAEAVASEAENIAKTSADAGELSRASGLIDQTLDEVNDQLAILGYYEAEQIDKDFNEAYGYMRNAEKKAVVDAVTLAKQLVNDLGLEVDKVTGSTTANRGKRKNAVTANIAPAGGDISIRLPLNEGRELHITIGLAPSVTPGDVTYSGDNLQATRIMYRVEWPDEKGHVSFDRMGRNCWADANVTYADLLNGIQRESKDYLPKSSSEKRMQELVDMAERGESPYTITPEVEAQLAEQHKKETTHNGYKIGDELMWDRYGNGKWEKVRIEDFDADGSPIFEMAKGIMSEKGDWNHVKPVDGIFGEAQRVARVAQEKKKKSVSSQKKQPEVTPEQAVGDLFSGLFAEPINDEKKTDIQPRPGTAEREGGHEPQPNEPLGESQRNEVKGTDGRGMGGRDSVNPMSDRERGAGVSRKPKSQPVTERAPESERKNVRNNHAECGVDYAPKGEDARIKANIEAIELAKRLLDAGETATPEQMAVLRKFSGWGGLGKAFNEQGYTPNPTAKRLRELLGEQGYQDAVDSRRSAYYTPAEVIDTMWNVAKAMGFKGGNVLEGSAGIGNIIGLMPSELSDRSSIHAVEIDSTTGGILSLLYPDAKVEIQGFEKTRVQNGSIDLAITNVPFITGAKVFDETGDKDLSKKFHDIHDFCIAKNIRKLREGGIGIFITSSGTMDNSKELRRWITNEGNADVVGAFRMHNKTFGGTGATSDIIVVRKRVNDKPSPNAIDVTDVTGVRVADYDTGDTRKVKGQEIPIVNRLSMDYNKYFAERPEFMAGEMRFGFEEGDTFRPKSKALYPVKGKEQSEMLTAWAERFADMEEEAAISKIEDEVTRINEQLGEGVKEGSMVLNSQGELCMARMGEAVPLGLNKNKVKGHTKAECFNAYTAIKKALSDVLEYQSTHEDNEGLAPLLKELNRAFDAFTRTYGNLHKNTAISFLRNDVDFSSILALETYSEKGDKKGNKVVKVGKTDIFSRRVIETEKEPQPTTIKDGILASLYKSGGVDVEYIGQALGKSTEDIKREIVESGLGFENPSTGAMEVSYQYLSGNVREKLHIAQENNEGGRYDANIKALEGVMPMTIPAHLIEFTLGSSWIEPKLYEDFVFEKTGIQVKLTNVGGTWFMKTPWSTFNEKNRSMAVVSKMCDKTIMGHELIESAITNKQITVSKTVKHYDGTTETITDKTATAECGTKVDEIRAEFKDWARKHMQADPEMSARIEQTYNDQFNNYVPMSIPDDFVPQHFGGQVSELHGCPFALRPHQGRAVVRGTTEPILLAHEVGTGKTYTLITTAMEMRRLGTARKPMIVVQNATVGQFVESANEIYPNAKVLTIEEADRTADGRKNFYAKIKYNDWDMIVVPQSVFERIPDSPEREMAYVKDIIEEKMKVLEAMREADSDGRSMIVRQAEKELAEQEERLAELTEAMQGKKKKRDEKKEATTRQNAEVRALEMLDRDVDDVENFDDMGIDAILVDEAHEYKHLGFSTAMQRGVKGVDPSYSKKSQGVFLKAQAVMERNNGRNVVFATGTPISNTAAEIWTFMRYLMPVDTMKAYGIYYFDDFVRNFGNIAQMVEFSTNGKFKENNRFAGYVNLPELVRIWSSVADTVLTREAGGVSDKIPDMEGGKPQDIYLPQTRALRSVMKYVKSELDRFEEMSGKEKKENSHIPLTMYGIAKAAAVDVRLVIPNAEDDPNSKTNATVRETLRSLKDSAKYKGTIAIFSDNYQNNQSGFNLYEDIRKKLIAEGVPADQIVVIKSGMTVKKKLNIFEKVNAGEIRVIMGSTFTLGTGVNIQERLHTLIHVDAPNRPMDYTQRNGRALRQGNIHKDMGLPVRIVRFGVEDSLDVTAYQRLKTKGAIADSIMNGSKMMQNSMENRVLEEEEDSFGDMTAQLSGSEYAILKNQAEREVRSLTAKQKGHDIDQIYVHNQLPKVEGFIKGAEHRIALETKNLEIIGKHFPDGSIKKITIGKFTFDNVGAMEDFFKEQNAKMNEAAEAIREGADNYTSKLTVDVDGLQFEVTTTVKREVDNKGQGTLSFEPERNVTYSCEALGIKDESVKGNRLKNVMQKIAEDIATGNASRELLNRGQQQLAHYSDEYRLLQERNGREFRYKAQLAEARERLAKYEEAMKKELEEKEAKYAEMDKSVEAATDVTLSEKDTEDIPTTGDGNKYRLVEDSAVLDFLDGQPLKSGFRYAQWANMGVLPPMTAKKDGEWRPPMIFSRWEQSEEGMRKENDKADLVQGNGRTTDDVAYNPYIHIRTSPLNDQFTAAYDRPELLVIEGYYPESEETSGYHAEGAKNSVGLMDWHSGSVNEQLSEDTKVQTMLSRYFKPWRIVPWSEVADLIMDRVGNQKVTFPINAVPPMLRAELAKRGAKFGDISGSVAKADIPMLNELRDRVNAGEWDAGLEKAQAYMDAYESSPEAMDTRVQQLSGALHTPVRIATAEETAAMKTRRERRAKGYYDPRTGAIVINRDNHDNVADIDNTVVHEVVGHYGLSILVGKEEMPRFMDEVYAHASGTVKKGIDAIAAKMKEQYIKAHDGGAIGEAHFIADGKEEHFRREATEEYMADMAGRIGSKGFEGMEAEELTLWGKIKARVQKFLDKFLSKLGIPKSIKLTDKDLAYILFKSWKNLKGRKGLFAEAEDVAMRHKTGFDRDPVYYRTEEIKDRVQQMFEEAVAGDLKGKGISIGRLSDEGRSYLEKLSGIPIKAVVDFVLNPSDLAHINRRHFGANEHDRRNIPLTIDDIRNIVDVITHPDRIVYGKEKEGDQRHMFFFLKEADNGSYNMLEVYADRRGNLTSKSFFKNKEGVSQRAMLLKESSALTSVTDGATLSNDNAKLPQMFETPNIEDDILRFRDPGMGLEEIITKMKTDAATANADNLQAKRDAMKDIGGNLSRLRQAMARQREYDLTTVKSVTDLAKILMDAGLLDDLSKLETKRILGAVNNVIGRQDVSKYVQKVMDIMVDNQLRMGANTLGRLLSVRGSRVDARGIEVQGELDPDGQRIAQVVRKATSLPKDDIDNRIAEAINRMGSNDAAIADEAAIEYAGLQIARQYVELITESKAEEKALRESIKQAKADKDAGQMTADAYSQFVEATEDAIRQNKIERAEDYRVLVEQVGGTLGESVERAKAWREAEKKRVADIQHNANSDMEGRPNDEHHKDSRVQKFVNNSAARFLLAPLATFDQMLRMFGKKNARGEGYLWNRYMRGWVDASEREYTGYRTALAELDEQVSKVFGKKMKWGDLFSIDRKLPKASVSFWDGGEKKDHELTQGNLLYIYMVDKMSDGRMKLRSMGITEEDVKNIKNFLDPRFIQIADWLQDEFLVQKRNKYNEVHKRMFGASMAAIENYFPLKILANARMENVDVADDTTDTALPATSTGSIIKRRRNNLALDVTGANAFSVILDHLQQMERWAAFAEFNRDLNTLLSYKRFRNQVMNMSSVYGAGKTLWNNFRNVCSMAGGAYRPPTAPLDKSAVNIAKGVTAAKVSFRVFTALKQFLSMPAYISDSNPMYLAANIANPIGAWKWSMKNLPLFEKRWSSRMAGDPRLLKSDMDWKMWRSQIVEIASRIGMSPNAFVDALTVAIGSHSMYQTKLAKYKRQGYDPDVAEARAKQDATILFNQTQQSSESAFLSTMQVDRSWLSVLFTIFRNSPMSYSRQLYDAMRNLRRRFIPGYKGLSEEFMAKQMRRDGIDPDKADRNVKQEYRRGIIRDLVRMGIFGYGLQLLWNMGAYGLYLIFGKDEDEKSAMWDDIFNHTMFGSIEGLTGGDVMSAAGNMWISGEGNPQYLTKDMPLASDVFSILKKMDKDQVSAMNDVINLLVQSTVGVNPQSLTDAVVAVMDYCGDDAETSRECALLIARVLNCPQSQLDKIYFDELDASGEEASQMTPSEIAERYARYKVRRGAPLTGWAYGNEQREKLMDKYRDRSNTLAKERLTRETDKQASQSMAQWLEEFEATKSRINQINKLKDEDEDRAYELLGEIEGTPEYLRYEIIKGYKRDVNEVTKEWIRAKTPDERDSCTNAIIELKRRMVKEVLEAQ